MRITALQQSTRMAAALASCVVVLASLSGASLGQGIPGSQGNLATLPSLTELQQPTATAVNQVCGQFGRMGAGYTADASGTPQQRLFYTCRVMVQTANTSTPMFRTQPTTYSLKIPNDELRTGVQASVAGADERPEADERRSIEDESGRVQTPGPAGRHARHRGRAERPGDAIDRRRRPADPESRGRHRRRGVRRRCDGWQVGRLRQYRLQLGRCRSDNPAGRLQVRQLQSARWARTTVSAIPSCSAGR